MICTNSNINNCNCDVGQLWLSSNLCYDLPSTETSLSFSWGKKFTIDELQYINAENFPYLESVSFSGAKFYTSKTPTSTPSVLWGDTNTYWPIPVNLSDFSGLGELPNLKSFNFSQSPMNGNLNDTDWLQSVSDKLERFSVRITTNVNTSQVSPMGIEGTLDAFSEFTSLEDLTLDRNSMIGIIPESIQNLQNLKSLVLSHNNISGNLPEFLYDGSMNLIEIRISDNNLSGEINTNYLMSWADRYEFWPELDLTDNLQLPMSQIKYKKFDVSNNNLYFATDRDHSDFWHWWFNSPTTDWASMMSCSENNTYPWCYVRESETPLHYIQLDGNDIIGNIPETVCDNPLSWELEHGGNVHNPQNYLGTANLKWQTYEVNTIGPVRNTIFNNKICPPYPSCLNEVLGDQNPSLCVVYNDPENWFNVPISGDCHPSYACWNTLCAPSEEDCQSPCPTKTHNYGSATLNCEDIFDWGNKFNWYNSCHYYHDLYQELGLEIVSTCDIASCNQNVCTNVRDESGVKVVCNDGVIDHELWGGRTCEEFADIAVCTGIRYGGEAPYQESGNIECDINNDTCSDIMYEMLENGEIPHYINSQCELLNGEVESECGLHEYCVPFDDHENIKYNFWHQFTYSYDSCDDLLDEYIGYYSSYFDANCSTNGYMCNDGVGSQGYNEIVDWFCTHNFSMSRPTWNSYYSPIWPWMHPDYDNDGTDYQTNKTFFYHLCPKFCDEHSDFSCDNILIKPEGNVNAPYSIQSSLIREPNLACNCDGDSNIDECGECGGNNYIEGCIDSDDCSLMDCAGTCGGSATIVNWWYDGDGDGLGSGNPVQHCSQGWSDSGWVDNSDDEDDDCDTNDRDCSGVCGGDAHLDSCGFCICPIGGISEAADCPNGVENKEPHYWDSTQTNEHPWGKNVGWSVDDCGVCFGPAKKSLNGTFYCESTDYYGSYRDQNSCVSSNENDNIDPLCSCLYFKPLTNPTCKYADGTDVTIHRNGNDYPLCMNNGWGPLSGLFDNGDMNSQFGTAVYNRYDPELSGENLFFDRCGICGGTGDCDAEVIPDFPGCMDMGACNYNPYANVDDPNRPCFYPPTNRNCDGSCINDADLDGICDQDDNCNVALTECSDWPGVLVCDPNDCPEQITLPPEVTIVGCMDDSLCDYNNDGLLNQYCACNRNPNADEHNEELCYYPAAGYDCSGNCIIDSDNDGICDELDDCDGELVECLEWTGVYVCPPNTCPTIQQPDIIEGCTDNTACNFNHAATQDNNSCWYAPQYYNCDASGIYCISDSDNDGICDGLDTCPEGQITACTFLSQTFYVCGDENDCPVQEDLPQTDPGTCGVNISGGVIADQNNCQEGYFCHPTFDGNSWDGVCLSQNLVGCGDPLATNYDPNAIACDGGYHTWIECDYLNCCCEYTDPNQCDCNEISCLTDCWNVHNSDLSTGLPFESPCCRQCCGQPPQDIEISGCMNPRACNYNSRATIDDGSCYLPEQCNLLPDIYHCDCHEEPDECPTEYVSIEPPNDWECLGSYHDGQIESVGCSKCYHKASIEFYEHLIEEFGISHELNLPDAFLTFLNQHGQDASSFYHSGKHQGHIKHFKLENDFSIIGTLPNDMIQMQIPFQTFKIWNTGINGNLPENFINSVNRNTFKEIILKNSNPSMNGDLLGMWTIHEVSNLEKLDLSDQDFESTSFINGNNLLSLPRLRHVNLKNNDRLGGSLDGLILGSPALNYFDISNCDFGGPIDRICQVVQVIDNNDGYFDIQDNNFCPPYPECLGTWPIGEQNISQCELTSGCTDVAACNYDPLALDDDGSCIYPEGSCDCDGNPIGEDVSNNSYCDCTWGIIDECGDCGGENDSCSGCMDDSYPNYNPNNIFDCVGVLDGDDISCCTWDDYTGWFPGQTFDAGDLNADGTLNVLDVVQLANCILNQENEPGDCGVGITCPDYYIPEPLTCEDLDCYTANCDGECYEANCDDNCYEGWIECSGQCCDSCYTANCDNNCYEGWIECGTCGDGYTLCDNGCYTANCDGDCYEANCDNNCYDGWIQCTSGQCLVDNLTHTAAHPDLEIDDGQGDGYDDVSWVAGYNACKNFYLTDGTCDSQYCDMTTGCDDSIVDECNGYSGQYTNPANTCFDDSGDTYDDVSFNAGWEVAKEYFDTYYSDCTTGGGGNGCYNEGVGSVSCPGDEAYVEYFETTLVNGTSLVDLQYVNCWVDTDPADGTPQCGDGIWDYVIFPYQENSSSTAYTYQDPLTCTNCDLAGQTTQETNIFNHFDDSEGVGYTYTTTLQDENTSYIIHQFNDTYNDFETYPTLQSIYDAGVSSVTNLCDADCTLCNNSSCPSCMTDVYDGYSDLDVAGTDGYDDTSYDAGYEQGQVCGNNTCDEGVWDQILAAKNADDNTIMYDFGGDDGGEVTFAIYEYQQDVNGLSYEYVERSYIKTDANGYYTTGDDYTSYINGQNSIDCCGADLCDGYISCPNGECCDNGCYTANCDGNCYVANCDNDCYTGWLECDGQCCDSCYTANCDGDCYEANCDDNCYEGWIECSGQCCDSCYTANCDSGTDVCCGNDDCPDSGFIDMGCLIEGACSENYLLNEEQCIGLGGTWTSDCTNGYDNESYSAGYSVGYSNGYTAGYTAGDEYDGTFSDIEYLETRLGEIAEAGNTYDLTSIDCSDVDDDGTPICSDGTPDYVVYEYVPGWSYNAGTNTDCGCDDVDGAECNCPAVLDCCGADLCDGYISCPNGECCNNGCYTANCDGDCYEANCDGDCYEANCDNDCYTGWLECDGVCAPENCGAAGCYSANCDNNCYEGWLECDGVCAPENCGAAGCYSANCDDPSLCGDGTCPDSFLGFAPDFIKGSGSDTGLLKQQYFAFTLPAKCGDRFGLSDCTSEQLVCAGDPGFDGDCSEEFAECGEHGVCAQYETDRIMKASVFLNKDDDTTTNRFTVNNDYIYVNYADDSTQEFKKYFIYYSAASVLQWSSNYLEDAWFNGDGNNDLEPGRGYFIVAHNDYWLKWRDV